MSAGNAAGSSGDSYSSAREIGLMNQYKSEKKTVTETVQDPNGRVGETITRNKTINPREIATKKDTATSFREQGAYETRNNIKRMVPGFAKIGATVLSTPLQIGSRKTRDFFTDKVLGKGAYKGMTKAEFQSKTLTEQNKAYKDYVGSRNSGKTDAYGNALSGGKGDNNNFTVKKNIGGSTITTIAPTEAEVSQSEAANADAAALKVKKRGRSMTMMSGAKGVTKTSSDYSLGKKSLLGIV